MDTGDVDRFRRALGHFCTGVVVITGQDGEPAGFTCQSFASLSLEPPLVLFCVTGTSRSWPHIARAGSFAVNVLGARRADLARRFGVSRADKFRGIDWIASPSTGAPHLVDAVAWIDAHVVDVIPGGDHHIVIGRVVDVGWVDDAEPLLYLRGEFCDRGTRPAVSTRPTDRSEPMRQRTPADQAATATPEPSRQWGASVHESRVMLEALRFGCIRLCELACAALVRTTSVPEKLALSRHIWALAQAADLVGARLPGLRSTAETATPSGAGYVRFTNHIAELDDPGAQYAALVGLAFPDLRSGFMAHYTRLPELADELTGECLATVLDKLDTVGGTSMELPPNLAWLREDLERAGGVAGTGEDSRDELAVRCALPAIPHRPGRDSLLREAVDGEAVHNGTPASLLHNTIFRIELVAAEVCAAMIVHHPEAPWRLRYDLAKQVRDEARHFELFADRMRDLGGAIGDHPYRMDVWDKFLIGQTLPERLMIEQRIGEGTGLDSARKTLRGLRLAGDHKTAMIYEYVIADEITHVGNGSSWVRALLGSDEDLSLMEADLRQRLADRGLPVPLTDPINAVDLRLSGFRVSEIETLRAAREAAAEHSGPRR